MTQMQELLKIEIPPEEDVPFVVEHSPPKASKKTTRAAKTAGKAVSQTAKKAWASEPRRRITRGAAKGVTAVASKSSRFMCDKIAQTAEEQARQRATAVRTRLQETDWKSEAGRRTSQGLNWLSEKAAHLAAWLTRPEKNV